MDFRDVAAATDEPSAHPVTSAIIANPWANAESPTAATATMDAPAAAATAAAAAAAAYAAASTTGYTGYWWE